MPTTIWAICSASPSSACRCVNPQGGELVVEIPLALQTGFELMPSSA
jgi:hypothetical protein